MDYLNLDNSVKATERAKFSQSRCNNCRVSHPTEKSFNQQRKDKYHKKFSSSFNSHNYNNKRTEINGWKPNTRFRCGLEHYRNGDFQKLEKSKNKFRWNMEKSKNRAYRSTKINKMSDNSI